MNTFTYTPPAHPKFGKEIIISCIVLILAHFSFYTYAQQNNLSCNVRTPWIPSTFTVVESHSSPGLSCWGGDLGCVVSSAFDPANVVDTDPNNYATGNIVLNGSLILSVKDNVNDYDAGNFAGFVVSGEFLDAGLFHSITIRTYLNDVLRNTFVAFDLIGLDIDLFSGAYTIGFVTTLSFDEVEIEIADDLGLGFYNVHYAVLEKFCAGDALECNTETAMNVPEYPMTIDYALTGSNSLSVGVVDNPENAISASTTDFASLTNIASAIDSVYLTIQEQVIDYPSGTFVGFDIENVNIAGVDVFNYIRITSFLNGVAQQSVTGTALIAGIPLLSTSGRHTVGFVTNTAVDKVKIAIHQPLNISLGTTRVYSAIFEKLCAGPPLPCNDQVAITTPEYPVYIDFTQTGLTGVCVGCNVIEPFHVIDDNATNYAQIIITAGAIGSGSLAVKDQLTDYPPNTFAGFRIENATLVDADALTGITVSTYLDGVLQESRTNINGLLTINSDLLLNDDQQVVGFVTTQSFDEVKISLQNLGSVNVGTTRIFELVLGGFCAATIACNSTYFLNNPVFPVYIDAFRTGIDGGACVACVVQDEGNVITADTADYGKITIVAGALGYGSIAVADALYTYPAGTYAGFVIRDMGFLLQADLFQTLTISTYNNGVLQESKSGGQLLEVNLLILFINSSSGVHNVGFLATLPFDEIRITVGALVGAINQIRVYSAFVDTNLSEGGSLMCDDTPNANNDSATTNEDTPVSGSVQTNDTPSTDGGNVWSLVGTNGGAMHGTVVLNPDGTYTYTPNANYNGPDSFTYQVCDVNNDCDQATVSITVNPIDDLPIAADDNASTNEDTPVSGNAQTNDTPSGDGGNTWSLVGMDGGALHGNVTMNPDGSYTYTPDPDYNGMDQFTYQVCDGDLDCDQATVTITIGPIDDQPDAVNDTETTDEDTPVTSTVVGNDTPSGDGGNIWSLVGVDGGALHGTVNMNSDGSYTYTPDPNYNGTDQFTYQVCDGDLDCDQAVVNITIDPIDDLPVANNDNVITTENTPVMGSTQTNDTPSGDGGNAWTLVGPDGGAMHGDVLMNPDGTYTYTPDPGYTGNDQFTYEVCDTDGDCDQAVVFVTINEILPVALLSFNATKDNKTALLDWKTTSEYNSDFFEIEKAGEDKHFSAIGKVSGAGNSSSIQAYRFVDSSPFSGMNYYRLRQVDMDGNFSFSAISALEFESWTAGFAIWPNPTNGKLFIRLDDAYGMPFVVRLYSLEGVLLTVQHVPKEQNEVSLDLTALGAGIYHLVIMGPGVLRTEKVVKTP